jgi:hypothetical protein
MTTQANIHVPNAVAEWFTQVEREAYMRGWNEATQAILLAAAAVKPPAASLSRTDSNGSARPQMFAPVGGVTNRERVIRALQAKPGMRPREVAKWIQSTEPEIKTRSIETAVKRMKGKEIDKNRSPELYLTAGTQ